MDPDGKQNKKLKREEKQISFLQRYLSNVSNVLSSLWIRCTIQDYDGTYRFVLGSRRYLLLNFRMFLVILYFTFETLK